MPLTTLSLHVSILALVTASWVMILSTTSLFISWSMPETACTKLLQIVLFIVYMNSQVMFTFATMGQVVVCHRLGAGGTEGSSHANLEYGFAPLRPANTQKIVSEPMH